MDNLEDRTQNKSQPGVVSEDPPLPALFFTFCASEEGDPSSEFPPGILATVSTAKA